VQVFDSWAGILSPKQYEEFSLRYIEKICNAITEVPVTVFAKGAYFALPSIGKLNCETVGLDWNMPIAQTREIVGPDKTLQGNLDPCALYGSFDEIKRETKAMIDAFGKHRHIANLGHGVYPDTDPEKVKCFIETVKEYSVR
jgi:uroporphyrinogen decarboxylase